MHDSWNSAFDSVHAEPELKEHTKEYLRRTLFCPVQKRRPPAFRFAAISALCLAFFLTAGLWLFFTPAAYISVDINPSIELGVNRFSRIISVESYNEDGAALAKTLDLRFLNYMDALNRVLENDTIADLLSEDGELSLTVAGNSESQSSRMLQEMEASLSDYSNVHCHSGNMEEMHEAHDCGMSFGKYQAYLILKELNPSVTEEEVQGMTMKEIQEQIRLYSDSGSSGNDRDSQETPDVSETCEPQTSGTENGHHGQHSDTTPSDGEHTAGQTDSGNGNKHSRRNHE